MAISPDPPTLPDLHPLVVRILGPDGSPAEIDERRTWGGVIRWQQARTALVDIELRIENRWPDGVDLVIDFQAYEGWAPATTTLTDLDSVLDGLAEALFIPAAKAGVIGIDLADYAVGLQGLRVAMHQLESEQGDDALVADLADAVPGWLTGSELVFIGLHMAVPASCDCMPLVDACARRIEPHLRPDGIAVLAMTYREDAESRTRISALVGERA